MKPPFKIYHDKVHIGDADGHICTAENPAIAQEIVEALNVAYRVPSAATSTAGSAS